MHHYMRLSTAWVISCVSCLGNGLAADSFLIQSEKSEYMCTLPLREAIKVMDSGRYTEVFTCNSSEKLPHRATQIQQFQKHGDSQIRLAVESEAEPKYCLQHQESNDMIVLAPCSDLRNQEFCTEWRTKKTKRAEKVGALHPFSTYKAHEKMCVHRAPDHSVRVTHCLDEAILWYANGVELGAESGLASCEKLLFSKVFLVVFGTGIGAGIGICTCLVLCAFSCVCISKNRRARLRSCCYGKMLSREVVSTFPLPSNLSPGQISFFEVPKALSTHEEVPLITKVPLPSIPSVPVATPAPATWVQLGVGQSICTGKVLPEILGAPPELHGMAMCRFRGKTPVNAEQWITQNVPCSDLSLSFNPNHPYVVYAPESQAGLLQERVHAAVEIHNADRTNHRIRFELRCSDQPTGHSSSSGTSTPPREELDPTYGLHPGFVVPGVTGNGNNQPGTPPPEETDAMYGLHPHFQTGSNDLHCTAK